MLAQHAPEGVGADHEPALGPGGPAQFLRMVKTGLVTIQAKGQHVAHIGIGFHRPHQHHVVAGGKPLKLVPIQGPLCSVIHRPRRPKRSASQNQVFGERLLSALPLVVWICRSNMRVMWPRLYRGRPR